MTAVADETLDALGDMVTALNRLMEGSGYEVLVTACVEPVPGEHVDAIKQRLREDFAWLQTYLTANPEMVGKFCRNWVAVYDKMVISVGPRYEPTLDGAARQLDVHEDVILVVPIQVPESDEYMEDLYAELGLESD